MILSDIALYYGDRYIRCEKQLCDAISVVRNAIRNVCTAGGVVA